MLTYEGIPISTTIGTEPSNLRNTAVCFEIVYHNIYTVEKEHCIDREGQALLVCADPSIYADSPNDVDVYPDDFKGYGVYATYGFRHRSGEQYGSCVFPDPEIGYGVGMSESRFNIWIAQGKHASYFGTHESSSMDLCPGVPGTNTDQCCPSPDLYPSAFDSQNGICVKIDSYQSPIKVGQCYDTSWNFWLTGEFDQSFCSTAGLANGDYPNDFLYWKTSRLNFAKFQELGCCYGNPYGKVASFGQMSGDVECRIQDKGKEDRCPYN